MSKNPWFGFAIPSQPIGVPVARHRGSSIESKSWTRSSLGSRLMSWLRRTRLQQIPEISVQVLEDGNRSIRLDLRCADERDSRRDHPTVVPPEIIRAQEK